MSTERVQQQRRKLAKLAKLQGKSIAEVARQAIEIGLEQMAQDDPKARWLAALEAARQLRESMRLRNGAPLNIDVVGETHQIREARDAELLRRSGF